MPGPSPRRTFHALAALLLVCGSGACATRLPVVPAGQPAWVWSGAVTSTSATVKARIPGVPGAMLEVQEHDGPPVTTVAGLRAQPGSDVFSFPVSGLTPATGYRYRIAGASSSAAAEGRLRTLPVGAGRIVVAFASCASTGSNARVWNAMREAAPDLFVHMGDFHYEDIARDEPHRFRTAYDRALMSPRQGAFYRQVPIAYVWDDHDFGGDESDALSPSSRAAHAVYREYVPHYPLAGDDQTPIHQAFTMGRVRVIVTDVRTAREPAVRGERATRSLLGASQRTWLLRELERAAEDAVLVVWVNVVPWITKANEETEHGWAPWSGEREVIAAAIDRLGLTRRLVMLSGDAHMLALDDGTHSQYAPGGVPPGPVVMHAAPLDRWPRRKGGPYSHGTSTRNQQFGLMSIDDDGEVLRVELSGRDRYNEQVGRLHLVLRCTAEGCSAE
jgi:phosphodiesterase/alkaline phosphatase D-like protein